MTFVIYVLVCIGIFRLKKIKRPIVLFNSVAILCVPILYLVFELISHWQFTELATPISGIAGLAFFLFVVFCYGYIQTYAFIEMSITIQMLLYVQRKGGTLSLNALSQAYPLDKMLKTKIKYAEEMRVILVQQINGKSYYTNTSFGNLSGRIFFHIKQFLQWGKGG